MPTNRYCLTNISNTYEEDKIFLPLRKSLLFCKVLFELLWVTWCHRWHTLHPGTHCLSFSSKSPTLPFVCPSVIQRNLEHALRLSSTLCPLLSTSVCCVGLAPLASEAQLPPLDQTVGTLASLRVLRASAMHGYFSAIWAGSSQLTGM